MADRDYIMLTRKNARERAQESTDRIPYVFRKSSWQLPIVDVRTGETVNASDTYHDTFGRLAYDFRNGKAYDIHFDQDTCAYLAIEISLHEFRNKIETLGFDFE